MWKTELVTTMEERKRDEATKKGKGPHGQGLTLCFNFDTAQVVFTLMLLRFKLQVLLIVWTPSKPLYLIIKIPYLCLLYWLQTPQILETSLILALTEWDLEPVSQLH